MWKSKSGTLEAKRDLHRTYLVVDMDAFFAGKPDPDAGGGGAPAPALNTLPKYQKYVKMQKMHMPEGAIRGKMRMDKITDAEQDAFFAGKGMPAAGGGKEQFRTAPCNPMNELKQKNKLKNKLSRENLINK